jgi:hypothetical protein
VIALSHLVRPRSWSEFFVKLREKDEVASFFVAFLHLPMGALIVAFHNKWSGLAAVLTLIGWAWVLKGLIYFMFPRFGLRMLSRVSVERYWEFMIPGSLLLIYAGALGVSAFGLG